MDGALKRSKSVAKARFTRRKNALIRLLESDLPARSAVSDNMDAVQMAMDNVMEIMGQLREYYKIQADGLRLNEISDEMEKIEREFESVEDFANEILEQADNDELSYGRRTSVPIRRQVELPTNPTEELQSQIEEGRRKISNIELQIEKNRIALENQLSFQTMAHSTSSSQAHGYTHSPPKPDTTSLMFSDQHTPVRQQLRFSSHRAPTSTVYMSSALPYQQFMSSPAEHQSSFVPPQHLSTPEFLPPVRTTPGVTPQNMIPVSALSPSPMENLSSVPHSALMGDISSGYRGNSLYQSNPVPINAIGESRSHAASTAHQIGDDLWRQLRRVSIPTFSGNKKNYESWKAVFYSCVDKAPATPEYKLLQLRGSLQGEPLRVIEGLGHSAAAYDTAKEILERKYGGKRRLLALRMQELESFKQIRDGNAKDLERFTELLEMLIVNLKEANQENELGSGSLYISLQRKLNESLLAKYHRWIFENCKIEGIPALREFANKEAEFLTTATETIKGLRDNTDKVGRARSFVAQQEELLPRKKVDRKCVLCDSPHGIWNCEVFKTMSVSQRWDKAKELKLCFRCLNRWHQGSTCPRSRVCGIDNCKSTHSRMLHEKKVDGVFSDKKSDDNKSKGTFTNIAEPGEDNVSDKTKPKELVEPSMERQSEGRSHTTTMASSASNNRSLIALRTVPVLLKAGLRTVKINALLDDASTQTYLNSEIASELGLQGQTQKVTVNVLNGQVDTFETMPVTFNLQSLDRKINEEVNAFTVDRVTGDMEVVSWQQNAKRWSHLRGIEFPDAGPRPTVDILIGADYAELHCSLKDVRGEPGDPIARLTPLGWTCIGNPLTRRNNSQAHFAQTYFTRGSVDLDQMIRRFWEIENSGLDANRTDPEKQSVKDSALMTTKFENGHYQVSIPWKTDPGELPDNSEMAFHRLKSTENRLSKNIELSTAYKEVIDSYMTKGYIRKVSETEKVQKPCWYLPHFPVVRPDKETTKVRIVFDASAKCENVSLNDCIDQGPKLQVELFDVLIRFRRSPVALAADIAEMYLQIEISPRDRPYHRFMWRDMDLTKDPDVYEFSRVVFGVNSSPFLAQLVSQHHAEVHYKDFPLAAETVLSSTYMDDSLDSVKDDQTGIALYEQLSELWTRAGMHARKWLSSSPVVMQRVPPEDRASQVDLDKCYLPSVKTLGIHWSANDDIFTFKSHPLPDSFQFTKRNVLKKVATLFDPLGFLMPFTIRAKILIQDMWSEGLDWDDPLHELLTLNARRWFRELDNLDKVRIPRCIQMDSEVDSMSLHVFVDASEQAYGSAVYARNTYHNGEVSCHLIAAKTRVAPLTAMSIPRLELLAAVLGLRLAETITNILQKKMSETVFWSDSINVLWWIRGHSRHFKPFVANRIGNIQSSTSPDQWRYIPTNINPADLLTRGIAAGELISADTWWQGPVFLKDSEVDWPENRIEKQVKESKEMKKSYRDRISVGMLAEQSDVPLGTKTTMVAHQEDQTPCYLDPKRFSNWRRLTRIQAWVNRFIDNCKLPQEVRSNGELKPNDLREAEFQIVRKAQKKAFWREYLALSKGKELPKDSKLLALKPILDEEGVIRSDGRLKYAEFLPYDVRYPVILPRKDWVTKLVVKQYHEDGKHVCGTNQTLSAISTRYWIISAREEIRAWEKECAACRKLKASPAGQIMAPLPKLRLQASLRAFTQTSVDYGGPFYTKQGRGRSRAKRYLCLFTCLATRAVHLELAYSMDTDSFMNAFYRFASRRGRPQDMLSDNGGNFIGADKELRQLVANLDQGKIEQSTANKYIKWHFNPPLAPHFSGVHEAMIKSAKRAIYAILRNAEVTDEELLTAFAGAEGLINSRPLTYQSAHPQDDTPLTPNHFLHGSVGGQFAPESVDKTHFSPRRRWRHVQELVRHFWHRWMREWLPCLTARKKWFTPHRDVKVGDVVLIIAPDTGRGKWPMGRIVGTSPGKDNHVRVVKVQIGNQVLVRPISRICPVDCNSSVD